jgi:hypothetical protein
MRLRIIFILLMAIICTNLFAQSVLADEERFFYGPGVDKDFEFTEIHKSFSNSGIQYGAILSPIFLFEDNDGGRLGSYILNAKVWARVYLWDNSFFYIMGKNSYLGIITNKGSYEPCESDNVLDLDLAYIAMTFQNSINISLGRNYYTIGTGLVLNGRGDGAEVDLNLSIFNINLLGLYTGLLLKDNNPYQLNEKDISDGAKRGFGGGTVSAYLNNQKIYLFGLAQIDFSDQTKGSETKYNSQYYGIGLEGVFFSDISYYAEFVYETGKSYIINSSSGAIPYEKSTISAYAINSGINYYIPAALSPMLILQYSFGSGDKSRTDYVGSNRAEGASGNDTGFVSFGAFTGGYALKANLGNIHIIRGGFSFSPFNRMSLGAKYLYYLKDKKEAPINSGEADLPKAFIGQGVDVSFRWQIFYDLSMYINYGLFLPGDAYDSLSNGTRNFVMAGVNLSI